MYKEENNKLFSRSLGIKNTMNHWHPKTGFVSRLFVPFLYRFSYFWLDLTLVCPLHCSSGVKTNQLQFSDVFFPPEVLLVDSYGREEVVEVHDSVHEAVEQRREEGATPGHKHHRVPSHESYGRVVVQVQKRHLVELLPQQHEPLNTVIIIERLAFSQIGS